jgi:hypothetical protein
MRMMTQCKLIVFVLLSFCLRVLCCNAEYKGLKKGLNANDVGRNVSSDFILFSCLPLLHFASSRLLTYQHLCFPFLRVQLDDTEKRLKHYERTIFDLKVSQSAMAAITCAMATIKCAMATFKSPIKSLYQHKQPRITTRITQLFYRLTP